MSRSIPPPLTPRGTSPVELHLVVWLEAGSAWRARVSGPGVPEREFASPFELARFVAGPLSPAPAGAGTGLR